MPMSQTGLSLESISYQYDGFRNIAHLNLLKVVSGTIGNHSGEAVNRLHHTNGPGSLAQA